MKEVTKVAVAASAGTAMEYYDLFLAAPVSALVWTSLYFRYLPAATAVAMSMVSFFVSYITRPVGAVIFGHYTDRLGRKKVLIVTLIVSGVATVGLALTPGYLAIGMTAPILIIFWRLVFGLGMGGEQGGAQSWIGEFCDPKRRGFWTSVVYTGSIGGSALGSLSLVVCQIATGQAFFDWGWRIAYGVGFLGLVVAGIVRMKTRESPIFQKAIQAGFVERAPSVQVLKKCWRTILLGTFSIFCTGAGGFVINNGPYAVALMQAGHVDALTINECFLVSSAIAFLTIMGTGLAADKIGRRRSGLLGIAGTAAMTGPAFFMLTSGNPLMIIFNQALAFTFHAGFFAAAFMTTLVEKFPTRYRASGVGFTYQFGLAISTVLLTGAVLPWIIATMGVLNAYPYAALLILVAGCISLVCYYTLGETRGVDLEAVATPK